MTKDCDAVVIGGGPAGISGANTAAIFGKRVALVEKLGKVGGAGINTGTIPSKTLRETAFALSGWRSRKLFGVDLSLRRDATVEDFMRHKEHVSAHDRKRREEQPLHCRAGENADTCVFGSHEHAYRKRAHQR